MDYQSNSKKSKEEPSNLPEKKEKKIEKVVTGAVATKPKSLGSKFKAVFMGRDVKGIVQYIAAEVLFPAARNAVVDATTKGIERAVYGDSPMQGRRPPGYGPRTTYNSPVNRYRDPRTATVNVPDQATRGNRARSRPAGRDYLVTSRAEAEAAVDQILEIINQYDVASVADLHEMLGLPSSFTDQKWGWTFFNDVEIRQDREGWLLEVPPIDPINTL